MLWLRRITVTEYSYVLYAIVGQFYTLHFKGNSSLQLASQVKTVLALTFFEEPDTRVEHSRWQYWYNLQPNPNQKAFDIGKRMCLRGGGKQLGFTVMLIFIS